MFNASRAAPSAPPTFPLPSVAARAWRAAPAGAPRLAARNVLAGSVRALSVRVLVRRGLPRDLAEELAHEIVYKLLSRIEDGRVAPGSEDAYVRASARNRATDLAREQSGVREVPTGDEEAEASLFHEVTAEELMLAHEEQVDRGRRLASVHEALRDAPPRYRQVLTHVYVQGREIEELVLGELVARGATQSDGAARRRVRGTVDKLLERARVGTPPPGGGVSASRSSRDRAVTRPRVARRSSPPRASPSP